MYRYNPNKPPLCLNSKMVMVEWSKFGKAKLKSVHLIYYCSLFKPVGIEIYQTKFFGVKLKLFL